jgi:hypothetical protein
MSLALGALATAPDIALTLDCPVTPDLVHQLSALPAHSPHGLILQFVHVLAMVVRLVDSLNEGERLTLLGEVLTLEKLRLEPMQRRVEMHKTFLSDLSAKQARKRRRRKKRVAGQVDLD